MDGFWIVNMQGHLLDVNDTYCDISQYSREELLKMNMADIEVGRKPNNIIKHLQKVKRMGKDRFIVQHRKKDGKIVDIEASANYSNYLGEFVFIFIRDIGERKKIEGQLADSYKHLGLINRKISLLLELGKFPKSKKYKQEIIARLWPFLSIRGS
jgi:PAS domain S-box-containing protein